MTDETKQPAEPLSTRGAFKDINALEDKALELRAKWRKADNYWRSFTTVLFEMKAELDTGAYGPEWTFDDWMVGKVGLWTEIVMKQLSIFERALAGEHKEKVAQENERIADEKRAAEAAAKAERETARQAAQEAKQAADEAKKRAKAPKKPRRRREPRAAAASAPAAASSPERKAPADHTTPAESPLDHLMAEIIAGRGQIARSKQDWADGTMRVAMAMKKARGEFPADIDFGNWLDENGIDYNDHDRAALIKFGQHPEVARTVLERTERRSYQLIWLAEVEPELKGRFASASKPETSKPATTLH